MTKRALQRAALGLVLLPALAAFAGGWAVITVEDLPDRIVAGEPVQLTYTVRQHGVDRLNGLRGEVEAEAGRLVVRNDAQGQGRGVYRATLTLPEPGVWTITINSGFGTSRVTLLPITAVAKGAPAARPLAQAELGRQLFVAKGCVTCHTHGGVKDARGRVGPELTGRRFPADDLAQFLANPSIRTSTNGERMPNLELRAPEIAALVSFLNTGQQAGAQ